MNISSFFIERPIFATVLSIIIVVAGLVAMPLLPVSEFPEVVPPTVVVSGRFPGASPKTIAETVITPLEQQVNGVENALYVNSSADPDGSFSLTVTFRLGTNLDTAQVQTQNRVAQAEPRLPEVVRQIGLVTQKRSPDLTMVVFLRSPDKRYDSLYLRNYAVIQVRDVLARLPGMGDVRVFGSGDYAMRLWLDPGKVAARGMTVDDVLDAVREQNAQVAAGQIGGQPAMPGTQFGYIVNAQGRLTTESEFGDIIIKTGDDGDIVYLRDVARVALGPETYSLRSMLDSAPAVAIPIFQLPGANALELSQGVRDTMAELSKNFPEGLTYEVTYDPTIFVRNAIAAVVETLLEAVLLVVLVVVVFLQGWRASVVPLVAVPVAIVGTLAVLLALGFSINALTLFGLVLATGIVVDDAIVVVENIERKIEGGLDARAAAHEAMREVTRPIISIMLVLCAVFIPVAFLSGITGQFYRQFAITIAASTVISTFNSLTLSPALAAILLRPKHAPPDRFQRLINLVLGKPFALFNRFFERVSHAYAARIVDAARLRRVILAGFVLLLGGTWLMFQVVPSGFIPAQDKGYLIAIVQLPDAASLDRTEQVVRQLSDLALQTPGIEHAIGFPGLSANGFVLKENSAVMFLPLQDFSKRRTPELSAAGIIQALSAKLGGIPEAYVLIVPPPAVTGLGSTGGFKLYVQDRAGNGYDELARVTGEVLGAAREQPELLAPATYTSYQNSVPQLYIDVDRNKAKRQGVPLSNIFGTLQTYLGSSYVNDFNAFGRTFRVYAQAEARFRARPEDIANLKTRNVAGDPVPIGSVAIVRFITGPDRVLHYNVYLAADVNGQAAPGYSSGQATVRHGTRTRADTARRLRLRMDRTGVSAEVRVGSRIAGLPAVRVAGVPDPRRAVRELGAAAGDRADRADVPAVFADRGAARGRRQQRAHADRLHRARGAGVQERHPHRGVRARARGAGHGHRRRGSRSLPPAAASHPHDLVRVHHGCGAAGDRHRRRQRTAQRDGHRRFLGDVGRHAVWPVPDAGILRGDRAGAAPHEARAAGGCAAGRDPGASIAGATRRAGVKRGTFAVWLALLTGCAAGPDYEQPATAVPASFSNVAEPGIAEDEAIAQFWTLFNEPELNQLVSDALAANKDLARAAGNLQASRAAARLVGFDAFPTVTAGGSYIRYLSSAHQSPVPGATRDERTVDTYDVGFDASWELDLFGRVRRSREAAHAQVDSAEAILRDAIVIVTAEVARNYCVLRGLQDQLAVAERNATNQRQTLDLTQTRLEAGRGTELDVSRASAQLALTESTIPPLRTSIATTIHRLSVLTGRQPELLVPQLSASRPMPKLPVFNSVDRPDELLRRRPDIRIAERNLAASTARIGVAVGDLFPRVTLVGSAGYNAASWNDIGSSASQTWFAGPAISWAAFDLGRVRARIGIARAATDIALADYEAAVLNALEDTENSLITFGDAQRREGTLVRAATHSTRAASLARQRFEGGLSDFLVVLQAERDALIAEDGLAQARMQTATSLIAVYKALGGGWMTP